MRTVNVVSTKGSLKQIQTNASVWSQLVKDFEEQGFSVDGLKAIVAETKNTLESGDAVLPTGNFTLFLSPINIKAGADSDNQYEFDYTLADVDDLSYTQLRAELKAIRTQASELEDDNVFGIIGNYTHDTVDQLREKLTEVYELFEEVEEEVVEVVAPSGVSVLNLASRVLEIEFQLGIVNDDNREAMEARYQASLEEVVNSII